MNLLSDDDALVGHSDPEDSLRLLLPGLQIFKMLELTPHLVRNNFDLSGDHKHLALSHYVVLDYIGLKTN